MVSSLFAVWRDPSEPAKYASITYSPLLAYLFYAIGVALVVWRDRVFAERLSISAGTVKLHLHHL